MLSVWDLKSETRIISQRWWDIYLDINLDLQQYLAIFYTTAHIYFWPFLMAFAQWMTEASMRYSSSNYWYLTYEWSIIVSMFSRFVSRAESFNILDDGPWSHKETYCRWYSCSAICQEGGFMIYEYFILYNLLSPLCYPVGVTVECNFSHNNGTGLCPPLQQWSIHVHN